MAKVESIVERIKEEPVKEFHFKQSIQEGYYLKLDNDSIYLTAEEVNELLAKLHIRTDSILCKVFRYDSSKEFKVHELIYYIHELGIIKDRFSNVNATKESLVNNLVHLGRITKDKEIAVLDFEGIQQEELYNILHRKHLEYLSKYEDILLTEVNS